MSDLDSVSYGCTIKGLSLFSDTAPAVVALAATSVLGGLAGPQSGISDRYHSVLARTGFSGLVMGLDNPEWCSCQQVLLGPVEAAARQLRELSQTVDQNEMERVRSGKPDVFSTQRLIEHLKNPASHDDGDDWSVINGKRAFSVLRQPTLALCAPTPDSFVAGAEEALDGEVLVTYPDGSLLPHLLDRKAERQWTKFGDSLADAVAGGARVFSKPKKYGTSRVWPIRTTLFSTCSRRQLEAALFSEVQAVQRLLQGCWIIDPSQERGTWGKVDPNVIGWACKAYREAVDRIVPARRSGQGLSFEIPWPVQEKLMTGIQKLQTEIVANISPELMPFFRRWRSLPYQILWTLIVLTTNTDDSDAHIPTTLYLTKSLLMGQHDLLQMIINDERARRQAQARELMLGKLTLCGPCSFRELMHHYSVQRKELHAPVLRELIVEGKVIEHPDGRLEAVKKKPALSAIGSVTECQS